MGSKLSEQKNTTLADVAKYLNVSKSTVSRALNGSDDVSASTIKRVRDASHKLNYVPNEIARGLVTKTNKTFAAFIPDILNPYYAELLKVIETEVNKHGFSLLLCITEESDEKVEYYIKDMMKRRVSGIFLLSTLVKNLELFEQLKSSVALVDIGSDAEGVDRICHDNKLSTYKIVSYLTSLGHRDIGFIGYKLKEMPSLANRLEGYKMAIEESGLEFNPEYVCEAESTNNPGYSNALKLLSLPHPPTAIHCMNEYIAMGAFIAITEKGLKIPYDISLTAFDDLAISKLMIPRLTTIHVPLEAIGEAAVEMLVQIVTTGQNKSKRTLMFDFDLVVRDSTAPPNST